MSPSRKAKLKAILWVIGWTIPVIILVAQVPVMMYYLRPVGYSAIEATSKTWHIYAQLTEDPSLEPAIQEIRELAQDHGQIDDLQITEVLDARAAGFTTVNIRVFRGGLQYHEQVKFDHDGTYIEIISTEVNRYAD